MSETDEFKGKPVIVTPNLMKFMGEQYNVPRNAVCIKRDGSKGKTAWYTYETKFVRGNTGYEWEKRGPRGIHWGYCEPFECKHDNYDFNEHGRRCYCGKLMDDFGD